MASSSKCANQPSMKPPHNANGNDQDDLHTQLWHECAGFTVKIPHVGDKVFYFPQGHLEQVEAYMNQEGVTDIPTYGLPSKILCKVVCVQLKAEVGTDEVFAQITLLPDHEKPKGSTFKSVPKKIPANFFRKKLTASDVSKQGGCSLPKRHVDETFPPLDINVEAACQDLVAKDLHGNRWDFHHICRGIPRRHLLTSGWGTFVSAKRLLVGDTCIFLRGKKELYVGVQRAVRLQKLSTDFSPINMQHGILATAREAINKKTEFTVYYHPRISPSGFLVEYNEYMESLKINYTPKTWIEMVIDEGGEEPAHVFKKYSGVIIGREDVDSIKWPNSEWRCLKVCWDAILCGDAYVPPARVSPWSIQLRESVVPRQQSLGQRRSMPFKPVIGAGYTQGIRKATGLTLSKVNLPKPTCKDDSKKYMLFGVNMEEIALKQQSQNYIKVLKHGAFLGRSIDISRFSGYVGLVSELDKMFDFEGTLVNHTSGWLVMYTDTYGYTKVIGDLSYSEFKGVVRKMIICPKEEFNRLFGFGR